MDRLLARLMNMPIGWGIPRRIFLFQRSSIERLGSVRWRLLGPNSTLLNFYKTLFSDNVHENC